MILKKFDKNVSYRPIDVFTLDALLYLAYSKQWQIEELTPVQFVPMALTPYKFRFAMVRDEPINAYWGAAARSSWDTPLTTHVDYEEVDLEHIAFGGSYMLHWRVGWRPSTKSLVIGLDRDDNYVNIERR